MWPRGLYPLRFLGAAAIFLAGGFASYAGFTTTIVKHNPPAVQAMGSDRNPTGQSARAQVALARADYRAAITAAQRSLAYRPLDAGTLFTLALAQLQQGLTEEASRSLTLASQIGWRDEPTQRFLLDLALQSGDAHAAALRIDALARGRKDLLATLAVARDFVSFPGGGEALAERLAEQPLWRNHFLSSTDLLAERGYSDWIRMLTTLEQLRSPANQAAISAFERTLVAKGQPALAARVSRRFGVLKSTPSGDFAVIAQGQEASPFAWSVVPGYEAWVSQAAPKSLTVKGDGRATGPVLTRLFPLSAGSHTLSVRAQGDVDQEASFEWQVACLPFRTMPPLRKSAVGAGDGRQLSLTFATGADCPVVQVGLGTAPDLVPGSYSLTYSIFSLH